MLKGDAMPKKIEKTVENWIVEGEKTAWKKLQKYGGEYISRVFRCLAVDCCIFYIMIRVGNLSQWNIFGKLPLWENTASCWLNQNMFNLWIAWFIVVIFFDEFLKKILIGFEIQKNDSVTVVPLWETFIDLIDVVFSLILLLFMINLLVVYGHNPNMILGENPQKAISVSLLYGVCLFARWLYRRREKNWNKIKNGYTDYFDSGKKWIAENDYVVFFNKLYVVVRSYETNTETNQVERIWKLQDLKRKEEISLEEAVKDKDGNLYVID